MTRKHLLAAFLAIGITVLAIALGDSLRDLGGYGYAGVFLVALISHASFVVPDLAFTFAMGSVLNPWIVGAIAGLGEGLGELTGYLAGYAGQEIVSSRGLYTRVQEWMRRYGAWTIFAFAAVPNPVFKLVGMAAGAAGMPWPRFFLVCWAGKTLRSVLAALIGSLLFTRVP